MPNNIGSKQATHVGGELRVLRVVEVREGGAGVHDGGELRRHRLVLDVDGREAHVVVRRAAQHRMTETESAMSVCVSLIVLAERAPN